LVAARGRIAAGRRRQARLTRHAPEGYAGDVSVLQRLRQRAPGDEVDRPRSRRFAHNPHDRFWWHRLPGADYVPPLYGVLSDDEWRIVEGWYADTLKADSIGEINVPAMSMIQGLIMGSAIRRIVQLGHYYGYSALLVGFMLRAMGAGGTLFSIDIDPKATDFTQKWVDRAGLGAQVGLHLGDSAAQSSLDAAVQALGAMPELILLDSSHQYEHTLRELDLWVPRMAPGSIMLLHDTSVFAQTFDTAGAGGVQRALDEWLPDHPEAAFLSLNRQVTPQDHAADLVYKDGCGLGILQRLR
jgi:predicted O-methyltransferase YrrM